MWLVVTILDGKAQNISFRLDSLRTATGRSKKMASEFLSHAPFPSARLRLRCGIVYYSPSSHPTSLIKAFVIISFFWIPELPSFSPYSL